LIGKIKFEYLKLKFIFLVSNPWSF